jgi:hypothetical protein
MHQNFIRAGRFSEPSAQLNDRVWICVRGDVDNRSGDPLPHEHRYRNATRIGDSARLDLVGGAAILGSLALLLRGQPTPGQPTPGQPTPGQPSAPELQLVEEHR